VEFLMTLKLTANLTTPILAFALVSTAASAAENFRCGDPALGITISIDIAPEKGVGGFDGMGRGGLLTPDGQGAWVNKESGVRFIPEQMPPAVFLGTEQFTCQNAAADPSDLSATAPDVATEGAAPSMPEAPGGETDINAPGRSLGGKLREGPGTEYPDIASLPEGMPVILYSNSHVEFNGFEWFRVVLTDGRVGYQWGGILCSEGQELPGLLRMCGATN
jgi:hypothetical protein